LHRKIFYLSILLLILFITGVLVYQKAYAQQAKEFLPTFKGIKSPGTYGSIVLNRYTGEGQVMKSVVFPHWWHRTQFTCKVCHNDIGFPMKAGATDIRMADIFEGKFCGKCHNGNVAFAATECDRCHSLGIEVKANRNIGDIAKDFPKADFGNKIDWVKALRSGKIKPKGSLEGSEDMWIFDKDIDLPVTKFFPHPPDVVYPHKAHTEWLSCGSCHPNVFNMKANRPILRNMPWQGGISFGRLFQMPFQNPCGCAFSVYTASDNNNPCACDQKIDGIIIGYINCQSGNLYSKY